MRIVTRPDFDGITCSVLLREVENIEESIKWVEPNDMQKGLVDIRKGDIIANLPYNEKCSLWFDHHITNKINTPFKGLFKIAPSAARVVFEYYKDRLKRDYSELVRVTDRIDAADLTMDEVINPEENPCILLSMTISNYRNPDEKYWNKLVYLFGNYDVEKIVADYEVKQRCELAIEYNKIYYGMLKKYTKLIKHVSVTDFRTLDEAPTGNRFLVYSMFPDSVVSVKIRYDHNNRDQVIVSVGHSIFNRKCNVNVGHMLSQFEGGGHKGAGACSFHVDNAEKYIEAILDILLKNKPQD